ERPRQAVRRGNLAWRLHDDPGAGHAGRSFLHPRQLRGRPALCRPRPAHPVSLMATVSPAQVLAAPVRRRNVAVEFMLVQPLGAAGFLIIVAMAIAAAFAPWVAPYDPLAVDYGAMLAAPSVDHWLGTDSFGRDVLSRIIYGARTALAIGLLSSAL